MARVRSAGRPKRRLASFWSSPRLWSCGGGVRRGLTSTKVTVAAEPAGQAARMASASGLASKSCFCSLPSDFGLNARAVKSPRSAWTS